MDTEEKEIRRILQAVAEAGAYEIGHVKWIQGIANQKATLLQIQLKDLLGVQDCSCEN